MKSLIENIGLALHKVKPIKGEVHYLGNSTVWKKNIDAVAAVIVRPANLCSHPECIHERYNDFVTLCETGKFLLKKKEDTPKHSEGDSLDVRIIKMSAAEALTLLGGMSLQQLLFGEDSDYVPDSIHRH